MDRERGSISATDYMGYAGGMEKTVARMLGDEISENALSFENDVWQTNNGDAVETAAMFANCTDAKCKVFDASGGGLDARAFPAAVLDATAPGDVRSGDAGVYALRVAGVGTDKHDLVLMITGVDQNTCKEINRQLGIDNPSGFPPSDSWAGAILYAGSFTGPTDATDEIGDVATSLNHHTAGCVNRAGSGGKDDNAFYQVLLPR